MWRAVQLVGDQMPAPAMSFEAKEPAPANFYITGGTYHNGKFIVQTKSRQVTAAARAAASSS